jgi:hypothetical protein
MTKQCEGCGKYSKYTMTITGVVVRGREPQEVDITCCRNGQCLANVLNVPTVPHKFHYARPTDVLLDLPDTLTPGMVAREVYTRYGRHGYSETWCTAMIHEICSARNHPHFFKEMRELYRLMNGEQS